MLTKLAWSGRFGLVVTRQLATSVINTVTKCVFCSGAFLLISTVLLPEPIYSVSFVYSC